GAVRAIAGRRVADPGLVALIEGCAHDGGARDAAAERACVVGRAGVGVLAGRAVGSRRIGARAGQRVADVVRARILIAAVDRRPGDTCARRRVAGLDTGTGVAVVAVGVDRAAVADADGTHGGAGAGDERTCDGQ